MKKIYILISMSLLISLFSCEKWLDVDPRSVVKEEEMFNDIKGFQSALLGVYTKMAGKSLYGVNLSFGYLDVLAQYYNIESGQHSFYSAANYKYNEAVSYVNNIWGEGYNAIANINNILKWLPLRKDLFGPGEYDLIRAEAIALRAFIHFDILRLYAPSYTVNPNAKAIPYVNKLANSPFPQLTVKEVTDAALADLTEAAEILSEIDPISPNYTDVVESGTATPQFFTFRYERMNYFAVYGTMARIALWRGDKEKAFEYATEAYKSASVMFSLFTDKSWDNSDLYFNSQASVNSKLTITDGKKQQLYETEKYGSLDTRYKDWFRFSAGSNEEFMAKYMRPVNLSGNPPNIVVMRRDEMAYILSECSPDDATAITYLNAIRSFYGIKGQNALVAGSCVVEEEIFKEYRKTFIGEGQLFFYIKRKNYATIPFSLVEDVQSAFVMPIPDIEIEFGIIN
ncbi:MAG: hypothetical protein A2X18_04990 [Bacteroidetes bacterium GWF2_40_14]|nr:MAG: hypothetical protein A2X18_04990 [Bacteroidetes bacterium GWF2_40_14]